MPETAFFQMETSGKPQEIAVRLDKLIYKPGDWAVEPVEKLLFSWTIRPSAGDW